ncbi:MAG: trigger factor [Clostridia bacterium]|nr:trigger factor [Clostridia bacterium]
MNYTFEKQEKSQVKLTVKLDKQDWEAAILKAYQQNKGKYAIQGFRKGHVPFNVICKVYGKEAFYEDAINVAINQYYPEIMVKEAKEINVIGDPQFGLGDIGEEGIEFFAMIPVMPEVKVGQYTGIKVEKVEYNVTDEQLDAEVERVRERNAREISVTDRACQNGDIVVIDYSGSVDGVKFDGGTAEKQRLELGSGSFIPGFEDQVVGMAIGEDRDINVTFPEDYTAPLNGKAAVFAIKLHEIIVKELPEVDDDFIKEATGEESLEAFRQKTRENMQKSNERRAKDETEDKLLTAIADQTEVEIPDVLVNNEVESMLQQFKYRLMYQGLNFETYLKVTNQTEEQIKESYRETALPRVKKQLIVGKIVELEKIEATQEEIDAKIDEQAKSVSKEPAEYRKTMDERQVEYIRNSIVVDKLFDFLTANNEIA